MTTIVLVASCSGCRAAARHRYPPINAVRPFCRRSSVTRIGMVLLHQNRATSGTPPRRTCMCGCSCAFVCVYVLLWLLLWLPWLCLWLGVHSRPWLTSVCRFDHPPALWPAPTLCSAPAAVTRGTREVQPKLRDQASSSRATWTSFDKRCWTARRSETQCTTNFRRTEKPLRS